MVYENELWHSFLLRSQIMYNLSNCRNIISKHGALRYDAFPRFELIDMYKLHSLQDIYDILATRNGYILTSNIVSLSSGVYGYFNAVEDACRKNFHITNSSQTFVTVTNVLLKIYTLKALVICVIDGCLNLNVQFIVPVYMRFVLITI